MNNLLEQAKKNNIDLEIFSNTKEEISIVILNDEIEKYEISNVKDYSIKAKIDNKIVKYDTDVIDDKVLDILKENASIIDNDDEDIFISDIENNNEINIEYPNIDYQEVIKEMFKLNDLKKEYPELISLNVYFGHDISNISLLNTNGVHKEDINQMFHYYCELVINTGENQTSYFSLINKDLNKLNLKEKIIDKIKEAIDKSAATSVKTDKYNIVLNNESVYRILSTLSSIYNAENINKKLSPLVDKYNTKIFNEIVTIVEDPTNENLVGKRLFDNEGTKTYYKEIIKDGVFVQKLYNNKSAIKDNTKSSGNSYGVKNMYLLPGNKNLDELFKSLNNGIYIDSIEGLHAGINTITTNISLQAQGYLIENGKKTKALKMIVLSTTLFELLNNIKEIGNDLEFFSSKGGSPSILVENISIAGKM